ncbi:hypothetical protein I317_05405 [Kwoniella heveanensis CBS 569]|nr:hypothetical protein I317_05405 [Kwoniella heveanensis CBS 569]
MSWSDDMLARHPCTDNDDENDDISSGIKSKSDSKSTFSPTSHSDDPASLAPFSLDPLHLNAGAGAGSEAFFSTHRRLPPPPPPPPPPMPSAPASRGPYYDGMPIASNRQAEGGFGYGYGYGYGPVDDDHHANRRCDYDGTSQADEALTCCALTSFSGMAAELKRCGPYEFTAVTCPTHRELIHCPASLRGRPTITGPCEIGGLSKDDIGKCPHQLISASHYRRAAAQAAGVGRGDMITCGRSLGCIICDEHLARSIRQKVNTTHGEHGGGKRFTVRGTVAWITRSPELLWERGGGSLPAHPPAHRIYEYGHGHGHEHGLSSANFWPPGTLSLSPSLSHPLSLSLSLSRGHWGGYTPDWWSQQERLQEIPLTDHMSRTISALSIETTKPRVLSFDPFCGDDVALESNPVAAAEREELPLVNPHSHSYPHPSQPHVPRPRRHSIHSHVHTTTLTPSEGHVDGSHSVLSIGVDRALGEDPEGGTSPPWDADPSDPDLYFEQDRGTAWEGVSFVRDMDRRGSV